MKATLPILILLQLSALASYAQGPDRLSDGLEIIPDRIKYSFQVIAPEQTSKEVSDETWISFDQLLLMAPIFTIVGALVGVIATLVVNWKIKKEEVRLRLLEKLFDKRLLAHEDALEISAWLRTTVSTKQVDLEGNLITYPVILENREEFLRFQSKFYELVNFNTHWFNLNLFREINFVQDYIGSIDTTLKETHDDAYPKIGEVIKKDFTDLASSLEREALKFFDIDIDKMRIVYTNEHHKYKRGVTHKRLQTMLFNKKWNEIEKFINQDRK